MQERVPSIRSAHLRLQLAIALAGLLTFGAGQSQAGFVFDLPANTNNGQNLPVAASATFSFSSDSVTITIQNLEANLTASNQLISGLQFTLSGTPTGQSFSSGTAVEMNLSPPNYTLLNSGNAVATTRWHLASANELTALGGGQPSQLIIGPPNGSNQYSNANGGSHNFNPNLFESGAFTLTYAGGVTSATTLSDVKFEVGTDPSWDGVIIGVAVTASDPDPSSLTCAATGTLILAGYTWRRRRAVA
jgi:MYXO-CTERM domain-containing protein